VVRHVERLLNGEAEVGVSNDPKLLTMAAAARRLGMSRTWFWQKVTAEGNMEGAAFPPVEIAPGSYRFRRSDVDAFSERTTSYLPQSRASQSTSKNRKSKGDYHAFGD
jgi:predicted DNA-binding transcriptional regulator AlpA